MTNNTHPAAAERSTRRRWPLVLLAAPAAVAIWSGWVGLGQMAGFGVVHPLPGIADSWTLNSAERAVMGPMGWPTTAMAARYQHVTGTTRSHVAQRVGGLIWGHSA